MNAASSTTRTRAMSHLLCFCWGLRFSLWDLFGRLGLVPFGLVPFGLVQDGGRLGRRRELGHRAVGAAEPDDLLDLELQASVLGHPQAAGGEVQAVDVEVDGILDLAVELDDRACGQVQRRA